MISGVMLDKMMPMLAIKRVGEPVEVAKLTAFLLSDESTYTTGSVYGIDGGWTA